MWRDQKAFDARDAAMQKQLLDALQPIRVSDYDQRPYKTITVAPGWARPPAGVVRDRARGCRAEPTGARAMLKDLAEASRKEPGNVRFDVVQHTMRANHFTVVEVWRDQKALDVHVARPMRGSIATRFSR